MKGHSISRDRVHLGAGAAQTKRKLIAAEKRLQRGCWWPEEKINLEVAQTSRQTVIWLKQHSLIDKFRRQ